MNPDVMLFTALNGLAGRFPLFDSLCGTIVNDYFMPVTMTLTLLALWFTGQTAEARRQNQEVVLLAVVTQGTANLLVKFCNLLYFRPRPFVDLPVHLLLYRPTDPSIPSNPAAVGFAFATAVWLFSRDSWGRATNRGFAAWLFLLATLFALSRVIAGVHYPSDILAGALVGALSALIVKQLRFLVQPLIDLSIRLGQRLYLA